MISEVYGRNVSQTFRQLLSPSSMTEITVPEETTTVGTSDAMEIDETEKETSDKKSDVPTHNGAVPSRTAPVSPSDPHVSMTFNKSSIQLELTHPDVTPYAVGQMMDYLLNDT